MTGTITVNLSDLIFDPENPRLDVDAQSQTEALQLLLDNHEKDIAELACDIARNGLSPSELPIVIATQNKSQYIVLEGNRRLVALKWLHAPFSYGLSKHQKKIHNAAQSAQKIPDKLDVVVAATRDEANIWIRRRHTADPNTGVRHWTPANKQRFEEKNGEKPSRPLLISRWIKSSFHSDTDMVKVLESIERKRQFTTLYRVFPEKVQKHFGITIKDSAENEAKFKKFATENSDLLFAILSDVATGKISTGSEGFRGQLVSRMNQDPILEWIRSIETQLNNRLNSKREPQDSNGPTTSSGKSQPQDKNNKTSTADTNAKAPNTGMGTENSHRDTSSSHSNPQSQTGRNGKKRKDDPRPSNANKLFYGVAVKNNLPGRLSDLLRQAKEITISRETSLIAAIIARVVVEHFVDAHRKEVQEKVKNPRVKDNDKLREKVRKTIGFFDPNAGKPNAKCGDLAGAYEQTEGQGSGILVKSLNQCVHNYEYTRSLGVAHDASEIFTPLLNRIIADLLSAGHD
ncbi:ParB N-terminal domain-containing protein [Arcanobacterium bovis]|uniref:Uncharacterized protein n=1 Tax=Arcanobacterium bovis TaxID=2529275 RepID=A0A4Q9UYL5_9ACTO|nr:ParB N-terminal domain-containing protein [Arcanobacterium bovis]TBW20764.1 hypothetical protein EZJ44_08245 [Arcanobacterium bovis]